MLARAPITQPVTTKEPPRHSAERPRDDKLAAINDHVHKACVLAAKVRFQMMALSENGLGTPEAHELFGELAELKVRLLCLNR